MSKEKINTSKEKINVPSEDIRKNKCECCNTDMLAAILAELQTLVDFETLKHVGTTGYQDNHFEQVAEAVKAVKARRAIQQ